MRAEINIALKDPFQFCVVILHKNINLVGKYDENYLLWERHELKSCFLETNLMVKLPSLPAGNVGDRAGYSFDGDSKTRASYFVAMEQLGLITDDGCDLSKERWLDTSFCLPFKVSAEIANYSPDIADKIIQKPIVNNGKFALFLEFENPTSYVIR